MGTSSAERVAAVLRFEKPDYVPLFDQYWGGFVAAWREHYGLPARSDMPLDDLANDWDIVSHFNVDLHKLGPVEDPWPSAACMMDEGSERCTYRDGWGRILRRKRSSPYGELLQAPLVQKSDLDRLVFESPALDRRYDNMLAEARRAQALPHRPYLFIKVGGPYLRSSFLRGEVQWFVDIAEDPAFAAALAHRVAEHLINVGCEAVSRSALPDTSIWIYDDIAANHGLLVSPKTYERLFLPEVRRMVSAFRAAGATHVGYHSDGDVRLVLDALVDAGITLLNPVEPRAHMDVVDLRRKYGHKLAFVGGLCNSLILPAGSPEEVREHVAHVSSVASDGGLVIGAHSVSPDISVERYGFLMALLHEHGRPLPGSSG
jgi:uroporphyrinogen decarboxylase